MDAVLRALTRPFVVFAIWYLLGGVQYLVNARWPALAETPREVVLVMGGVSIALGIVSIVLDRRHGSETSLTLLAIGAALMMTLAAAIAAGGQGQLISGGYLLIAMLAAGLFLPWRRCLLVLVVGLVGYSTGLLVNPRLDSVAFGVFVVVVIALGTVLAAQLMSVLRSQAHHDPLTGALNRQGLESAAQLVRAYARRDGRETVVIEVDLDGFKAYNDTFGHAAGDGRLVELVRGWQQVLRSSDVLARIGGDEFVILLPGTSVTQSEELLRRMRAANEIPWTAGVAAWQPHEDLSNVLRRADRTMYAGKANRRPGTSPA